MFEVGDKVIIKAGNRYSITDTGSIGVVVKVHKDHPGLYEVKFSVMTGHPSPVDTYDIVENFMDFYYGDEKNTTTTTPITRKIKSLSTRWANQQAKKGNKYALYLLR